MISFCTFSPKLYNLQFFEIYGYIKVGHKKIHPSSFLFLFDPGSRMGENQDPGPDPQHWFPH
jgi:hypothetical protein